MQRELGDVLFALTNLARRLGLDAEQALRDATDRFSSRFRHVELALAADGRAIADAGRRGARTTLAGRQARGRYARERVKVAARCPPSPRRSIGWSRAGTRPRARSKGAARGDVPRASWRSGPALLQRLGYGRDRTRARLAANLAWDFPDGSEPAGRRGAGRDRRQGVQWKIRTGARTCRPPRQRRNSMTRAQTLAVAARGRDGRDGGDRRLRHRRAGAQRRAQGSRRAEAEAGGDADDALEKENARSTGPTWTRATRACWC